MIQIAIFKAIKLSSEQNETINKNKFYMKHGLVN